MEPVGNHGLACLGDEDYAAIALWMQSQGTLIDTALDGISDDFDSFSLRPGLLVTSTAVTTVTSLNTFTNVTFGTTLYNNLPNPSAGNPFGSFVTPRSGWYQYGANINMIATGAVTAGSVRRLKVLAVKAGVGPQETLSEVDDISFDNNTGGGEWLVASAGSFYAPANTTIIVRAQASHANAASSVNVSIGARLWCWYIGSGVEIGSA